MNRINRNSFNSPSFTNIVKTSNYDKTGRSLPGLLVIPLFSLLMLFFTFGNADAQTKKGNPSGKWWSDKAESALVKAGTNRAELVKALNETNPGQREGMQFLIENMPEQDLKSLTATFLLDNLTMAYKGWQEAPWGITIPTDIFMNDILPYASVSEPRDNWRKRMAEISMPLIKGCKTPSEACKALNEQMFKFAES